MARSTGTFRLSDLTRALKGAKAAGIDVARIKITKDGIVIDTGKPQEGEVEPTDCNVWDTIK